MSARTWHLGTVVLMVSIAIVSGRIQHCFGQPPSDAPPCRSMLRTDIGRLAYGKPSVDGRIVMTAEWDGEAAAIWDVESGSRRHLFTQEDTGKTVRVWDVVSAIEKRLVVEVPIESIKSDTTTPRRHASMELDRLDRPVGGTRQLLIISPFFLPDDGRIGLALRHHDIHSKYCIYTCRDKLIIYDPGQGGHQTVFSADGTLPWSKSLDSDSLSIPDHGNKIAYKSTSTNQSLGSAFSIITYDIKKPGVASRIDSGSQVVSAIGMTEDGQLLGTVSYSTSPRRQRRGLAAHNLAELWNPDTGARIARVDTGSAQVRQFALTSKRLDFALHGGDQGNLVYIGYLGSYKITRTLSDFQKKPGLGNVRLMDVWYTPDGAYLIGVGADGTLLFWETRDYREVLWVRLYPPGWADVACSPDGKKVVSVGGGRDEWNVVKIWDFDQFRALMHR